VICGNDGCFGYNTDVTIGYDTNITVGYDTDITVGYDTDITVGYDTNITVGYDTDITVGYDTDITVEEAFDDYEFYLLPRQVAGKPDEWQLVLMNERVVSAEICSSTAAMLGFAFLSISRTLTRTPPV
jgi:hypothetical protein